MTNHDPFGFDSLSLDWLKAKPGAKWHRHPGDLAAWVADMDFPPPPVVTAALQRLLDGGDLGYPEHLPDPSPAAAAFVERCGRRYGWHPDAESLRELNDVTQGIQIALHHHTQPGDGVVVLLPSYPPFLRTVDKMNRRLVGVRGHRSAASGTGWEFDYAALEKSLVAEPAKVLLLCHPQNPTGHVFDEAELRHLADIAERRGPRVDDVQRRYASGFDRGPQYGEVVAETKRTHAGDVRRVSVGDHELGRRGL